jgi:hypothetical protein
MADQSAVVALEQKRLDFTGLGDLRNLATLLSDDYIHVHANGIVENKQQFLEEIAKVPRQIEPRSPHIRLFGATAVLTGEMVNHFQLPDREMTVKLYATQVAHNDGSGWKFVSFQAVVMPEQRM